MRTNKIPKGWRRLEAGTQIQKGDKFSLFGTRWKRTAYAGGEMIVSDCWLITYIRKNV